MSRLVSIVVLYVLVQCTMSRVTLRVTRGLVLSVGKPPYKAFPTRITKCKNESILVGVMRLCSVVSCE